MKGLLNSKLLIGVGVFAFIIIILVATGALKFSGSVTRVPSSTPIGGPEEVIDQTPRAKPTQNPKVIQQPTLAPRAINFTGAKGQVEFSIKLPVGWSQGEDSRVDFIAGSMTAETLPSGGDFTTNMNAIADVHGPSVTGFAYYQAGWKDMMLAQYPSMEFVRDSTQKINGMDVYILEVKNTRPDGVVIRQIQYVYYVDDNYGLVLTGSALDSTWGKYEGVIKASFESIEKVSSPSSEPTPEP